MLVNQQPREKPTSLLSGHVDVFKIWKTFQGEGPYTGWPSIFLRVAGCNLDCPLCDTDYTSQRQIMSPEEILSVVRGLDPANKPMIVITGGEPFRQDLGPLVNLLSEEGYPIQIETNGTLYRDNFPYKKVRVICSPKSPTINAQLQPFVEAYKYVIENNFVDPMDGLPSRVLGKNMHVGRAFIWKPIYIQPLDEQDEEKNKLHLAAAMKSCSTYGYRLSVQIHKIIGVE